MATAIQNRVSDVEQAIKELAYAQLRTEVSLSNLSDEMISFKNEMKAETHTFKSEMLDFKDEMRGQVKHMYIQWGNLANRLGTFAENIVAPNIPGILKRYFGIEEPDAVMVRVKKRHPDGKSRTREFDVIAIAGD